MSLFPFFVILVIFDVFTLFLTVILFPFSPPSSSIPVCTQSSDFSDISESAADYFSRSNRRGSIVSDLDDLSIPDMDTVSCRDTEQCAGKCFATLMMN